MTAVLDVMQRTFGFREFREGQEAIIDHLLVGRSAAAVFPTGGGKSLCYQLPALMLPGLTLVVSPLIALMKDQLDRLLQLNVAAARLDSTLTGDDFADVMRRVRDGSLRLLYVAPERFNNERFRESIERVPISLFAVDEAHCISEWGHSFRPDYLKLAQFARRCGAERVLALTATATPQVLDDICRGFEIDRACAVRTGFYRPNLALRATPIAAQDRDAALVARLKSRPAGPTIVYVTLQRTAEEVAGRLTAAGFDARPYHAGMETEERTSTQEWFLASKAGIVCATIAFGMGIDKSDIRYVYHYNLPKSLENLSQEIGRAGRDGAASICETFVCPDDLGALENFALGDTPSLESTAGLVREVFAGGESFDVSLYDLAATHDIRQLVVRTLLVYLELDGYIEEGGAFFDRYRFQPRLPSAEILTQFDGERREFLAALFQQSKKSKTWYTIDVARAAQVLQTPRERIVRALDYLGERQLLELKVEGLRNKFRLLKTPPDLAATARSLYERMVARERRDLARLDEVLDWAGHDGCLPTKLGEHFGEHRDEPCGTCSWCTDGRRSARLLPRRSVPIPSGFSARLATLGREHPQLFVDARRAARFLCGLTSPALSKLRLGRHPMAGCLSEVPFADVLSAVKSHGDQGDSS